MPRTTVAVAATTGSFVTGPDTEGAESDSRVGPRAGFALPRRAPSWPVGWGNVPRTTTTDGEPLQALVLMCEPAHPGPVDAWPIGVITLGPPIVDILVCVAERPPFLSVVDLTEIATSTRWHAGAEVWLAALRRIRPHTPRHAAALHGREASEALLARTRQRFDGHTTPHAAPPGPMIGSTIGPAISAGALQPDPGLAVVLEAQAVVLRAKWRVHLDVALDYLAALPGLTMAPVVANWQEAQVVAYDGTEVGCIYLKPGPATGRPPRWVAVPVDTTAPIGGFDTAEDAAYALMLRTPNVARPPDEPERHYL
jgi:inorganic pyrophosphatase